MKKILLDAFLSIVAVCAFLPVRAQVTTTTMSGRISDAEGPVAGVAVVLVYNPTGANYYAISDKDGNYRINSVIPGGPYTVSAECLGYVKAEVKNVFASLSERNEVDFTLQSSSTSLNVAIVTAEAGDSGMNIHHSGAITSVSEKTMRALPTVSRSMNDVMLLTPQASYLNGSVSIGGGNYRSSYVTVDGAAFNNAFGIGGNLPSGGNPISLDALAQMSVSITPFDVRQSGFTGGAINAVTKSGSNDWHVSVYDYFTNDQLTGSRVGEDYRSLSKTLSNTVGASVSGPIVKNKLFFFVNFEYDMDNKAGSKYLARDNKAQTWGGSTAYNYPTNAFMNEVSEYLASIYNYNPGRYQNYSLNTPDWKLMARIDWNINSNNRINVRFNKTANKFSSNPSSSINPLSNVYDKNSYGRGNRNAMYYESARYFQEQNFTSLAAEWNANFSSKVNNLLRFTWSHQYEPRSFVGDLFPTVDILGDIPQADGSTKKGVLTTFGLDPFTYGNIRDVRTAIATDEVSIQLGRHNLIAGAQFEYHLTKNGYMQGGAGYYVYNSWNDFKTGAQPAAFAITHPNRTDLQQVYPSFKYLQTSLYIQDEWNVNDYFNLTYGLRLEIPVYPSIEGNTNAEFLEKAALSQSFKGMSTSDMPSARVNFSPRVGFNWDILHNRDLILRGGTGIYTGRIPFVWIVSSVLNSNCMQAQYISNDGTKPDGSAMGFKTNVNDILSELYGGTFVAQSLPAPTAPTIMDKSLTMPSTWKTSLAVDGMLPGGIKGTVEGIFNYNLTDVTVHKLGQITDGTIQLPGEPETRTLWKSEGIKNSLNKEINPYYITNSNKHGYYYSITAQLKKDFNFGLSAMVAYTRSKSMVLSNGAGDQVTSAYNTATNNKNGSNVDELGYSTYVSPNRLLINVSYRIDEGRRGASTFGLFYEGYNYCYVGTYAFNSYSYTIGVRYGDYINSVTNDGGAANLMYIPTDAELDNMTFTSEDNKAQFKQFIESDRYLSSHRGQYSQRGAVEAPWYGRLNFKFAQDINFYIADKCNTITLGVDIINLANLFSSNWGCVNYLSSSNILEYTGGEDGKYTFVKPQWSKYNSVESCWQMLLSIRYKF